MLTFPGPLRGKNERYKATSCVFILEGLNHGGAIYTTITDPEELKREALESLKGDSKNMVALELNMGSYEHMRTLCVLGVPAPWINPEPQEFKSKRHYEAAWQDARRRDMIPRNLFDVELAKEFGYSTTPVQ